MISWTPYLKSEKGFLNNDFCFLKTAFRRGLRAGTLRMEGWKVKRPKNPPQNLRSWIEDPFCAGTPCQTANFITG